MHIRTRMGRRHLMPSRCGAHPVSGSGRLSLEVELRELLRKKAPVFLRMN